MRSSFANLRQRFTPQQLIGLLAASEPVAGVKLRRHRDLSVRCLYHLADALAHEVHAVVEASAVTVVAMIGVGRKELRDEVAVSGVNLHRVKAGLHREPDSVAVGLDDEIYVLLLHLPVEGGGVEVKPVDCADRGLAAGAPVGHVSAVAELDAGLRAFSMNRVGEPFEFRNNLLTHPKL